MWYVGRTSEDSERRGRSPPSPPSLFFSSWIFHILQSSPPFPLSSHPHPTPTPFLQVLVSAAVLFHCFNHKINAAGAFAIITGFQQLSIVLLSFPNHNRQVSELSDLVESITLSVSVELASPGCLVAEMNLYVRLAAQLVLVALILGLPWIALARHCKAAKEHRRRALAATIRSTALFIIILYPVLSERAFSFWQCLQFGDLESTGFDHSFHAMDLSLACYDATFYSMIPLVAFVLLVFALGIPCLLIFILYRRRNRLQDPEVYELLSM